MKTKVFKNKKNSVAFKIENYITEDVGQVSLPHFSIFWSKSTEDNSVTRAFILVLFNLTFELWLGDVKDLC